MDKPESVAEANEVDKPGSECAPRASLCYAAIAGVASEAFILSMLDSKNLETIKRAVTRDPYWKQFCADAKAGRVPINWLPGALGLTVLGWAKQHFEICQRCCHSLDDDGTCPNPKCEDGWLR